MEKTAISAATYADKEILPGVAALRWVECGVELVSAVVIPPTAGPYIQDCHLVANVHIHIRSLVAVVEEVWCFHGFLRGVESTDDVQPN